MKFKKTLSIIGVGILAMSLSACTFASPKNAYVGAVKKIETASSYVKSSNIHLDVKNENTETAEEKNAGILMEVLSKSAIQTKSIVDQTNEKSETLLSLDGKEALLPIHAELLLASDTRNKQWYVTGDSLVDSLGSLVAVPPSAKGKLIELQTSDNEDTLNALIHTDFSGLLAQVEETKFIRHELSEEEKNNKINDKITLTLSHNEIQTWLEKAKDDVLDSITLDEMNLTAYLNRKGELIQEETTIHFSFTNNNTIHSFVVESDSLYEQVNETVHLTVDTDKMSKMTLKDVFETQEMPKNN